MVVTIKLTEQSEALLKKIRTNATRREFYRRAVRSFEKRGPKIAGVSVKNYLTGQRLRRRSGILAQSVVGRGGLFGGIPGVRIGILRGPALKYAGQQEYGTRGKNPQSPYDTIRPKKAKALAMPIGKALTPAGVDRYGGPRNFPGELRFVEVLRANVIGLLVPEDSDPDDDDSAVYILLSKVDLEPQWYLRDAMLSQLDPLARDIADVLVSVVDGSKK